MNHRVVKVHVLAEFSCSVCSSICLRLTNASVLPDGRIGEAEDFPERFKVVCNDCQAKQRAEEDAEREKIRNRRAWARKHGAKP